MEIEFIRKEIAKCVGSSEQSEVYLEVSTKTGESELVIKKTFSERYPVTKYDEVIKLYNRLNGGGGRMVPSLEDLTK
jgi:hypothetical protein